MLLLSERQPMNHPVTPYPDLDDEAPRGGAIVWLLVADALALLCGALAVAVYLIRSLIR